MSSRRSSPIGFFPVFTSISYHYNWQPELRSFTVYLLATKHVNGLIFHLLLKAASIVTGAIPDRYPASQPMSQSSAGARGPLIHTSGLIGWGQ